MKIEKYLKYYSILKSIRLKNIIKETTLNNNSTIYYNQSYILGDDGEFVQPLVVTLKKENGTWRFTSLNEGLSDN